MMERDWIYKKRFGIIVLLFIVCFFDWKVPGIPGHTLKDPSLVDLSHKNHLDGPGRNGCFPGPSSKSFYGSDDRRRIILCRRRLSGNL